MKKFMMLATALLVAGSVWAAKMSLSDARAKIGACIADPKAMAEVVKQLAAADQIAFLAEVNEAISKMPGSNEMKVASYLNVNRAAVLSAESGNKSAMIAEVFATVPLEALTVVNERFAADLLSRDADPSRKVSDEQFAKISEGLVTKINERCASAENGAARTTFAVLMMVRAANGSVEGLTERLVKTLPEGAQAAARGEWIPAALGEKQAKSYEPLLGSADNAGEAPVIEVVMRLAGPQLLEAMLGDVVEGTPMINTSNRPESTQVPIRDENIIPVPDAVPPPEPGPYQGQEI